MIHELATCRTTRKEKFMFFDLMIALAFIGIIIAPAIVAASTDIDLPEKSK
jgi:hypothetical protein